MLIGVNPWLRPILSHLLLPVLFAPPVAALPFAQPGEGVNKLVAATD